MSDFHFLKIKDIEKLTSNSIAVSFDIPNELKNKFNFYSGQYITLESIINEEKVRRSYSICSSPKEGLRIGIKKLEGGLFSSHAIDKFKKGDIIKVRSPEGRFYFKKSKKRCNLNISSWHGNFRRSLSWFQNYMLKMYSLGKKI